MTTLLDYLLEIRQAIAAFAGVQVEQYREQLLTATRVTLRIRLRLADNSFLEISEALVMQEGTLTWLSYRYHWQDATGRLFLRYDNAPYHPEIERFPHHKHVGETAVAFAQVFHANGDVTHEVFDPVPKTSYNWI